MLQWQQHHFLSTQLNQESRRMFHSTITQKCLNVQVNESWRHSDGWQTQEKESKEKSIGVTRVWPSHGYGPKRFFLGQNNEVISTRRVNYSLQENRPISPKHHAHLVKGRLKITVIVPLVLPNGLSERSAEKLRCFPKFFNLHSWYSTCVATKRK